MVDLPSPSGRVRLFEAYCGALVLTLPIPLRSPFLVVTLKQVGAFRG